jgi:hypothetical protein
MYYDPTQPVETVRVQSPVTDDNPTGFIVINKADLTDAHKLYTDPKAPKAVKAAAPDPVPQPWAK